MAGQQGSDIAVKDAARALADDQTKGFQDAADQIGQLDRDLDHPIAGSDPCPAQHTVVFLDPDLPAKANLGKLCQAVGIVRIGFVGRHVEGCFGMSGINADRRDAFGRQRMVEPNRQRARLEDDTLGFWSTIADNGR